VDWPEDLRVWRANESLLLGSVAHERDAWLEIDDSETTQLPESLRMVAR
jgi:hypothetical protein